MDERYQRKYKVIKTATDAATRKTHVVALPVERNSNRGVVVNHNPRMLKPVSNNTTIANLRKKR